MEARQPSFFRKALGRTIDFGSANSLASVVLQLELPSAGVGFSWGTVYDNSLIWVKSPNRLFDRVVRQGYPLDFLFSSLSTCVPTRLL